MQPNSQASSLHRQTLKILSEEYSSYTVFQEYPVQIRNASGVNHYLMFDFYIKEMGMVIECQGEQHFKPNSHFFSGKASFQRMKDNDAMKREWCEVNDLMFIELLFSEKITSSLLKSKIKAALKNRSRKR